MRRDSQGYAELPASGSESTTTPDPGPVAAALALLRSAITSGALGDLDDQGRLEVLRDLELLTRAAAALSVRVQVAFRTSQIARQVQDGVAPSRAGAAVAGDLALARMSTPTMSSRELTSARALTGEMPHTLAALQDGVISGFQARVITETTTCLTPQDRAEVDERLAPHLARSITPEISAAARGLVYEIDPAGFVRRSRTAAADRGVSLRPAPDVMALLTARLPAAQAVACHQALHEDALTRRTSGDPRTVQQLMADELYHRLTGRSVIDGIDIEIGLVMTDTALLAGTSDPADLLGYGPIPSENARDLLRPPHEAPDPGCTDKATQHKHPAEASGHHAVTAEPCPDGIRCTTFDCTLTHGIAPRTRSASPTHTTPTTNAPTDTVGSTTTQTSDAPGTADPASRTGQVAPPGTPPATTGGGSTTAARVWVRRLYTDPAGVLTARDPRRRLFTGQLRAALIARDRTCRTPWCGAPIRTIDHRHRHNEGGPTTPENGQGLCTRCNLDRERPRHLNPPPHTFRPPPPLLPRFLQ